MAPLAKLPATTNVIHLMVWSGKQCWVKCIPTPRLWPHTLNSLAKALVEAGKKLFEFAELVLKKAVKEKLVLHLPDEARSL